MHRMNRIIVGAIIGLVGHWASVSTGHAQGVACAGTISATSGTQRALTPATDGLTKRQISRSYQRAFAAGRRQAIADWSAKVRQQCASVSPTWLRARNRTIEACDQGMGGRFAVCVSARPGRRFAGF